jgi:hypothetical protein
MELNLNQRQELVKLRELRGKILDVLMEAAPASTLESYAHGEADGTQSVKRRSPKELAEWLDITDKKISILERALSGRGGIMTFSTNRYR